MSQVIIPNGTPGVEYRLIPGWINHAAGEDGSVWTRIRYGCISGWHRMIAAPNPDHGYMMVTIQEKKIRKTRKVGQWVLLTFVGEPPYDQEMRHLDGKKTHDVLSNLKYGTKLENADDKKRHGTVLKGERHQFAKLTGENVMMIREQYASGSSMNQLASIYGVHVGTIQEVLVGRTWKSLTNGEPIVLSKSDILKRMQGERHHAHKITAEQARSIKIRIASGEMLKKIAASEGTTLNIVKDISRRKTWVWL